MVQKGANTKNSVSSAHPTLSALEKSVDTKDNAVNPVALGEEAQAHPTQSALEKIVDTKDNADTQPLCVKMHKRIQYSLLSKKALIKMMGNFFDRICNAIWKSRESAE
jgi:hypothetical protein